MKEFKCYVSKETMEEHQRECLYFALKNPNENWLYRRLLASKTGKWERQKIWEYRIFDFWSEALGIAVESDGPEHDRKKDQETDDLFCREFGIITLRVRNKNTQDWREALAIIRTAYSIDNSWKLRQELVGVKVFCWLLSVKLFGGLVQDMLNMDSGNLTLIRDFLTLD